ncbi:hypothetical protein [Humisphaera borealis]|uniref:Uncharacterized protein n=1 Tax=Humisphaera borealis TaxID=2807512 RepID=A0A7M2X5B0_9BACT|nr:hypothetical protein [Humisphaera borealis]QOV92241.1 hypothetical protein IPV69_13145 [Humisphaera borealis]
MSTAAYPGHVPSYRSPSGYAPRGHRPGLVTAIGVTSIIVASLGLIAGVVGGLWTMMMYRSAQMVATASSGANARSNASSSALVLPTPDELDADAEAKRAVRATRRAGLLDLLDGIRPLSPAVRAQADGLLARHAERVVPRSLLTRPEVSTADLRNAIAAMGSLPPVQAGDSEGSFVQFKETGRLELYASRAVFKPADGSGTLRSAGPATAAEEDAAIAALTVEPGPLPAAETPDQASPQPPSPPVGGGFGGGRQVFPSGLNGKEVQSVTQKAQAATGGKLNTAQLAAVTYALQNQSPPLVKSQMTYSPIRMATVQPDGQALVLFSDGMLLLDSAGTVVQQSTNNLQEVTIDPIGLTLMIGEAVAAALMAAFLMASGILLLRNSPRAHHFHWVYAVLKLPLAVIGSVAFAWVMQDVISGVNRMSTGNTADRMTTIAVWMAVAGVLYPIALMIALATPTVRDYFAAERSGATI